MQINPVRVRYAPRAVFSILLHLNLKRISKRELSGASNVQPPLRYGNPGLACAYAGAGVISDRLVTDARVSMVLQICRYG